MVNKINTTTTTKCVRAHMETGALGECIRAAGVAPYTEVCHIHQYKEGNEHVELTLMK